MLILLSDIVEERFAEFFGALDFVGVRARYVEVHWFVAFLVGAMFYEAGVAAFDLDAASGFLLDVFDVGSAVADDLRSQVEALDRFKVDWNALFGPFPLYFI